MLKTLLQPIPVIQLRQLNWLSWRSVLGFQTFMRKLLSCQEGSPSGPCLDLSRMASSGIRFAQEVVLA